MREYWILTQDSNLASVFDFIQAHKLDYEIHLNRTRFRVPEGPVLTNFLLRFAHCCELLDTTLDLSTGLPKSNL